MAEVDFDDFEAADYVPRRSFRFQRVINIAGAVSSVAMVVALAWWGYHTTVRDVRGVPVVRALEGPMRITPDDPGGQIADNQGLSVNAIAATGAAGALPQELMLAPRPVELDVGDGPGLEGEEPPQEIMEAVAEATGATGAVLMPAALPSPPPTPAKDAEEQGLASTVEGEPIQEIAITPPAIDPTLIPPELKDEEVLPPAPPGAVTRSPRPPLRPASAVAASAPAAPVQAAGKETPASAVKPGDHLVQLGAFDTEEQVRKEWTRLTGKFGNLIGAKSLLVQKAVSNGHTFYRLRATGFEDAADARRFCSALLAENAACIAIVAQ
ncbi:SPOR domain-containing protein [Falsirhodobacter deserti]|uniref:SPOR domain-containing protein n=1 Tax=Falsirhodobacter deserti TaxID=1365611 RepID=UPI000FE37DF4|nr:SPOR domain-containing protein [Falsirhodobacter deserti]